MARLVTSDGYMVVEEREEGYVEDAFLYEHQLVTVHRMRDGKLEEIRVPASHVEAGDYVRIERNEGWCV